MIEIRIAEDALQDLNDGFFFYEAQEWGLGDYFVACLRADMEGLKISAGTDRVIYHDFHRLLSRVFPYGIFYTVEENCAIVWAILDLRRDPEWIQGRLEG